MLAFLGLPGHVTKWLPFADLSLGNSYALRFSNRCLTLQAVDELMSYRPNLIGGWDTSGVAAFVVIFRSGEGILQQCCLFMPCT